MQSVAFPSQRVSQPLFCHLLAWLHHVGTLQELLNATQTSYRYVNWLGKAGYLGKSGVQSLAKC